MSGTNQILPFATGGGANVLTPAAYAALTPLLAQGFAAGIAPSQQLNTVWRQSSFVAAAVAQLIADSTGLNVADDGVIANFENQLATAINLNYVGVGAGTANAVTVTYLPAITTLHDGMAIWVKATAANTGATTLNVNGLGVQPVLGGAHAALQGGELIANGWCLFIWNATLVSWVLIECTGGALQVPGGSYGVTPSSSDNTTKLATTAFVKRQGIQQSGVASYSANQVLTTANVGGLVIAFSNTAPITFTLPAASSLIDGASINFINASAFAMTVTRTGSDVINPSYGSVTSAILNPGDTFSVSLFGGVWECTSGSAQLAYLPSFGSALTGSGAAGAALGSQSLPGGFTLKWGQAINLGSADTSVTFGVAFKVGAYAVGGTIISSAVGYSVATNGLSVTGFNLGVYSSANTRAAANACWWAIGQ